jgi:hypothetical protein
MRNDDSRLTRDVQSGLVPASGCPAPEEMLETICKASGWPLDVVKVGLKDTAKEWCVSEPVMLERLYCHALHLLDNEKS